MVAKARIGFQAVQAEIDRRQRFEGGAHVLHDHFDHALTSVRSMVV